MSKNRKVLENAERNLLLKIMNFFEEEKNQKLKIQPIGIQNVIAMKRNARRKQKEHSYVKYLKDEPGEAGTDNDKDVELTEIERKLLENEEKYQSLLKSFNHIVKRAAAATGVSVSTLKRIKIEAKEIMAASAEPGTSGTPISKSDIILFTPKPRKPPKKRLKIDDNMISKIRDIIVQYTERNEVPTLHKILDKARRECNFPGGKCTLWKIITTDLGYKYEKIEKGKHNLVPKSEIEWETQYLYENDELSDNNSFDATETVEVEYLEE